MVIFSALDHVARGLYNSPMHTITRKNGISRGLKQQYSNFAIRISLLSKNSLLFGHFLFKMGIYRKYKKMENCFLYRTKNGNLLRCGVASVCFRSPKLVPQFLTNKKSAEIGPAAVGMCPGQSI